MSQPWPVGLGPYDARVSHDRLCTHPVKASLSRVKGRARVFTDCWQTFLSKRKPWTFMC